MLYSAYFALMTLFVQGDVPNISLAAAVAECRLGRSRLGRKLSNQVEMIYVPTQGADAGGSYEVTNSTTRPGFGELLVESALKLLKDAAVELRSQQ